MIALIDKTGTAYPFPASIVNGGLWVMGRGETKADVIAQALQAGLLIEDEEGKPHPALHVTFVHLGPHTLEPAVMAEDGMTMLEPPVLDERHHFNLLLGPPITGPYMADEDGNVTFDFRENDKVWGEWGLYYAKSGDNLTNPNSYEDGIEVGPIQLMDPVTVSNPRNRIA
jgi:hypothetical protein